MALYRLAKQLLGGTRLWRRLTVLRYYWELFRDPASRRKAVYGALPARVVYRMMQRPDFYAHDYFDVPKDPTQESGYDIPYVDQDHFTEVAVVVRDYFAAERVLEIGCARGWQVLALERAGVEARGIDISEYAVETAPAELAGLLKVCGCQRVPFPDEHFDMVLLMETLEHVPPHDLDRSIAEARRVCSRWIWASMPSMGANPYGLDGLQDGPGIQERYHYLYQAGIIDLAPFKHIARDVHGVPHHGHLVIASFDWWTEAFTRHGLVRRGDRERRINAVIGRAADSGLNSYALIKAADPAGAAARELNDCWAWERSGSRSWRTGAVELPPGLHRAVLRLKVADPGDRRDRLFRGMSARCLSADGEAVLGLRTFTRQAVPRAGRGGEVRIELPCNCEEAREVVLELRCESGFRAEPARPGRALLHAAAR